MDSYFRNCKYCGLGIFHNDFQAIDFFCHSCWNELEKHKTNRYFKIYKSQEIFVRPLFLWKEKESIVGSLIHGLKGGTPFDIIEKMAFEMLARESPSQDTIIVPVPSSKVGEKDHAYLIAKVISDTLGLPLWMGLKWENKTTNQKFLKKTERFVSSMTKTDNFPRGKHVILIDDLVTTGATATAAFKALKSPKQIEVWALACRI